MSEPGMPARRRNCRLIGRAAAHEIDKPLERALN
jgi:hypothetical protein